MPDAAFQHNPQFANNEPIVEPVFSQYPIASWTVGKKTLSFPVLKISESGGNRIVQRERPFRDGAKLDDVGSSPKCWTLDVIFQNTLNAEGGSASKPLYPNVLNEMIRSFDTHETGDLVVPTIGKVRARAKTYRREETNETIDQAMVVFDFVQDNEDNIDATAFSLPTAQGSVLRLAQAATFSAESDGTFDSSLADLNEFAAGLEAIATFPSNTLQDIDNQSSIVVAATDRVLNAFTSKSNNPKTKARAMLSDPDSSATQRKLVQLQDTSARARAELRKNLPPIIRTVFDVPLTIFDVAALTGQAVEDLLAINPGLDPLYIAPGAIVMVHDEQA